MDYEVTATRRRPQLFSTVVGQEFVASALANSINKGKIAHAYLFCGPRGVGKTSSARILARSLNCENGPTPNPCGSCLNCINISKGHSIDVIEIDGASNTGVSDVREIKEEVLFQPNTSRYKVYIIDEVHMLSISAFNALLKTIEEPPSYIVFIFATTEIHKVPATIRSRCQRYNFKLIDIDTIKNSLQLAAEEMGIETDSEALFWLAKESSGSLRDAYTLLDQAAVFSEGRITFEKIKEKMGLLSLDDLHSLMNALECEKLAEALSLLDAIVKRGVAIDQIIVSLGEYLRTLLLIKSGITHESILGYGSQSFSTSLVKTYTLVQIQEALSCILQLYRDNRYSLNPRFELDLFLVKLAQLKHWISPTTLLKEVKNLRAQIAQGEPRSQLQEQFPLSQPKKTPQLQEQFPLSQPKKTPQFQEQIPLPQTEKTPDLQEDLSSNLNFQDQKTHSTSTINKDFSTQNQNIPDNNDSFQKNLTFAKNLNTSDYNNVQNKQVIPHQTKEDKIKLLSNLFEGQVEEL